MLGAVLSLVASVKAVLPSVRLESKPRMADFARILAAVDQLLGTDGLALDLDTQGALASESLYGDPFVMALQKKLGSALFEGTSADLLLLIPVPDRRPKNWPTDPRRLTQLLNRQAPVMRKAGWVIDNDDGRNKSNVARWTIATPRHAEMAGLHPRQARLPRPQGGQRAGRARRALITSHL